jgi:hypothetical protein
MFAELAIEHDFTLSTSIATSCRWQLGLAPEDFRTEGCYSMRDDLYSRVLDALAPDLIVTVSSGFEPVGVRDEALLGLPTEEVLEQTTRISTERLLASADQVLHLEPLPIAPFHILDCFAAASTVGECAFEYSDQPVPGGNIVPVYAVIYRHQALSNDQVTSAPYDQLTCLTGSPCIPIEGGRSTMTDTHHVSARHAVGSRSRLWSILEPILGHLAQG